MVPMQKNNTLAKNLPYACFTILFILIGLTTLASSMNLLVLRLATINAEEQVQEKLEQAEALRQAVHLEGDVINPNGRIDFLTPQEKPEQEENISVCSCACLDYRKNRKRRFLFFKKSSKKQKDTMNNTISMENIDVIDENINKIPAFKSKHHKNNNNNTASNNKQKSSNSSKCFAFFRFNNTTMNPYTSESTSNNGKHRVKRLNNPSSNPYANRNNSKNNKFDDIELVDYETKSNNRMKMYHYSSDDNINHHHPEQIVNLTRSSDSGLMYKTNNNNYSEQQNQQQQQQQQQLLHHLDEITTVETNSKRNSI